MTAVHTRAPALTISGLDKAIFGDFLTDRKNFERYAGDDTSREKAWRHAIAASDKLGDEFIELVDSGRLKDILQPL